MQDVIAPITYTNPQYRCVREIVHISGAAYGWTKPISNKKFASNFMFIFTRT
jgi:hypothetical protein